MPRPHQLPLSLGTPAFGASALMNSCEIHGTLARLLTTNFRTLPLTWLPTSSLQGGYIGAPSKESPRRDFDFPVSQEIVERAAPGEEAPPLPSGNSSACHVALQLTLPGIPSWTFSTLPLILQLLWQAQPPGIYQRMVPSNFPCPQQVMLSFAQSFPFWLIMSVVQTR
jgi:hypothetical protein